MNEQERHDARDREALAPDVDDTLDQLETLFGQQSPALTRMFRGHNRELVRRIIETGMVNALRLPDRKTPLHNPKVAHEAVAPRAKVDPRAPTQPIGPARRRPSIGPRRGPR